jgi:hypothetical protein
MFLAPTVNAAQVIYVQTTGLTTSAGLPQPLGWRLFAAVNFPCVLWFLVKHLFLISFFEKNHQQNFPFFVQKLYTAMLLILLVLKATVFRTLFVHRMQRSC